MIEGAVNNVLQIPLPDWGTIFIAAVAFASVLFVLRAWWQVLVAVVVGIGVGALALYGFTELGLIGDIQAYIIAALAILIISVLVFKRRN